MRIAAARAWRLARAPSCQSHSFSSSVLVRCGRHTGPLQSISFRDARVSLLTGGPSLSKPLPARGFQHMASNDAAAPSPPIKASVSTPASQTEDTKNKKPDGEDPLNLNNTTKTTTKEQRLADWDIVKKLVQHIWPKGDSSTKRRVVLALSLLIGGKVSSFAPQ